MIDCGLGIAPLWRIADWGLQIGRLQIADCSAVADWGLRIGDFFGCLIRLWLLSPRKFLQNLSEDIRRRRGRVSWETFIY